MRICAPSRVPAHLHACGQIQRDSVIDTSALPAERLVEYEAHRQAEGGTLLRPVRRRAPRTDEQRVERALEVERRAAHEAALDQALHVREWIADPGARSSRAGAAQGVLTRAPIADELWDRDVIVFDTETTGLTDDDCIVELAAVHVWRGRVVMQVRRARARGAPVGSLAAGALPVVCVHHARVDRRRAARARPHDCVPVASCTTARACARVRLCVV